MKKIIFVTFFLCNLQVFSQSPPTVTLNSPTKTNYSTGIGEVMNISWTSTNQHHYGIFLWKGNEEIAVIDSPWKSSATSYSWTVPESVIHYDTKEVIVLNDSDYRIKIAIFNTQSSSDPNHATAGVFSQYITFTKGTNNNPPEHKSSYVTPEEAISGSQFTFFSTWEDPENDDMTVEMRYRKTSSVSWTYIGGNEVSYVPNTSPPRYKVTKVITGAVGNYRLETRAIDDKGLGANWKFGDYFKIIELQNNPPNPPSFQNVPSTIYQNQQINIQVKSGTDSDNDNTLIKLYASGTNYSQNNPYSTDFESDGSLFTIPLTFTQLGSQTITAFTEDSNGATSSSVTYNVTVQTQTSINNSPNQATFVSVPQEVNINESIGVTVKKGADPDNDATKIILYADDSNYSISNPYDSGLSTSISNITTDLTFTSEGTKTIYIKTVDENNAESNINTQTISVIESNNQINEVEIGNITFTASEIIKTSDNVFTLKGNVKANNLLEFTGDIKLDISDSTISGNGDIFLKNIPGFSEPVILYEGSFEVNVIDKIISNFVDNLNETFKMAEMPIDIKNIKILSDGVEINGKIKLPKVLGSLKTEINKIQVTQSNGLDLAGKFELSPIKFKGTEISGSFTYDTTIPAFTAIGTLEIPDYFAIGATIGFQQSKLNRIGLKYDNLTTGIILGSTGLKMTGVEGDVNHISDGKATTVKLTMFLAPVVGGNLISLDEVYLNYVFGAEFSGGGKVSILNTDLANAKFKVEKNKFNIEAEANFYDVVIGKSIFNLTKYEQYNSLEIFGQFQAAFQIPDNNTFRFLKAEGIDLPYMIAGTEHTLVGSIAPNGNSFVNLNGSFEFNHPALKGYPLKISYYILSEDNYVPYFLPEWEPLEGLFSFLNFKNNKENEFQFIDEIVENKIDRKLLIKSYSKKGANSEPKKIDFILSSSAENLMVSVKPENSAGSKPNYWLESPSGQIINSSYASNNESTVYIEDENSKEVFYLLSNTEIGTWKVFIEDDGQNYIADLVGIVDKPVIHIQKVEESNNNIKISWTDFNQEFDGRISLFYDIDNKGFDGTLIESGISEDNEDDFFDFNISNLNPGTYYVYARMYDEEGVPVSSYSTQTFSVGSNIEAPTNLNYTINNDNSVTFNWTPPNNQNYTYNLHNEQNGIVTLESFSLDAGNESSVTITGLDKEPIYQFMVVAKDSNGNLSNNSNVIELDLAEKQTISLNKGWNLIGFGIESFNTNPSNIAALLGDNLLQIKTESESFNPNLPDFLNTLGTIENGQGYWANIAEETTLNIRGKEIDLSTNSIFLNKGWNLISYPSLNTINVEMALQSISNELIQIKNINNSYNPQLPDFLNTLKELKQGEGYWINVNKDCTLTF